MLTLSEITAVCGLFNSEGQRDLGSWIYGLWKQNRKFEIMKFLGHELDDKLKAKVDLALEEVNLPTPKPQPQMMELATANT